MPKPLSKKDQDHLKMMEEIANRVRKKKKDPKVKKASYNKWLQSQYEVKDPGRPVAWKPFVETDAKKLSNGITTKKELFNVEHRIKGLDEDQARREAAAITEARDKAKCVSIPYNKGGYMYISPKDVKDIGKK